MIQKVELKDRIAILTEEKRGGFKMIKNLEEKKKIIETLTVSMCSAPTTPRKEFILLQWYNKWGDFSRETKKYMRLRLYKGHLVKSTTQAKLDGENCVWEYPELDEILQNTIDEYTNKYAIMKSHKGTVRKNIAVFVKDLEAYRTSCVNNLNAILEERESSYVAVNTSSYLKHYKSGKLTKGLFDLAKYSLIYNNKKLYSGTYDDVLWFLGKGNK